MTQIRHNRRESDRQEIAISELTKLTHYPGCFYAHHECAIQEIGRLQKIIISLKKLAQTNVNT